MRKSPKSQAAYAYANFAGMIGDSRTLWRIWGQYRFILNRGLILTALLGMLPIVQWLVSLERNPQPTRKLLTIERLQAWAMLAYYPLEHLYYLRSHGILPSSIPSPFSLFSHKKRIKLDANKLALWSCRFWAFYVLLHFVHLMEDKKLLEARQRSIRKGKGTGLNAEQKQDMSQKWNMFWSDVVTNLAYFPLTLHW